MQCAAAVLVLLAVIVAGACGRDVALWQAALAQGVLAALLGAYAGLARWWLPIQLLFVPGALTLLALALPPVLFLALFALLVLCYWSTFRTQVPYYPSGPAVWQAVADALPKEKHLRVIDIGSGLGGMALALAARRPDAVVEGIELAPLPWFASRVRSALSKSKVTFTRGDYEALDFGHYDVVFAYLSPAAMPRLWEKARQEMRAGSMLLSYEFGVPGKFPNRTISPEKGKPAVYCWDF